MFLTISMFSRCIWLYPRFRWILQDRLNGCLVVFSINGLYTWPDVVELCFYHRTHTQKNGEPAYGQWDSESSACMSQYAPRSSQFWKDHIWTQLSLKHTTKQIYDKHEHFNGNLWMSKKPWPRMASFNNKTLHIWINNIREGIDDCTQT